MDFNYLDREGRAMTRQEVHQLPAAALAERSGVSLRILPNREALYETAQTTRRTFGRTRSLRLGHARGSRRGDDADDLGRGILISSGLAAPWSIVGNPVRCPGPVNLP